MAKSHLTIDVLNMPEMIWAVRREMAKILREEADGEPELVARKLRGLADRFEAGAVNEK